MDKKIPSALLTPIVKTKDYFQDGKTKIVYAVSNQTADFTKYLPTNEPQAYAFDTNECSTISATKCLEIIFNSIRNDFSVEELKTLQDAGYIDENGNFNFSERFSGIMAGTSINGNSQNVVAESIRKFGLLPQRDLNYSMEQSQKFSNQFDMCRDYYNPIAVTDAMKEKAKKIFDIVTIKYEWIWANGSKSCPAETMLKGLKQAPIQVGTPICSPWNITTPIKPCGDKTVHHATTIYKVDENGLLGDLDHYTPYLKTLSPDYFIPYALKYSVTLKRLEKGYVEIDVLLRVIQILRKIKVLTGNWLGSIINSKD